MWRSFFPRPPAPTVPELQKASGEAGGESVDLLSSWTSLQIAGELGRMLWTSLQTSSGAAMHPTRTHARRALSGGSRKVFVELLEASRRAPGNPPGRPPLRA